MDPSTLAENAARLANDAQGIAESAATLAQDATQLALTQTAGGGDPFVFLFTVFVLAVFVGFEIITKIPPTLHTPLMSGSNAISGITLIGALLSAVSLGAGYWWRFIPPHRRYWHDRLSQTYLVQLPKTR